MIQLPTGHWINPDSVIAIEVTRSHNTSKVQVKFKHRRVVITAFQSVSHSEALEQASKLGNSISLHAKHLQPNTPFHP